jgi:hypothetical protein
MSEKKTKEKRLEELSKKLGDLTNTAHNAHTEDLIHTVKRTGDYIVTLAFETANGKYEPQTDGDLDWVDPEHFGMLHVEAIIQDRDDKRFIPYLDVVVRIYDKEAKLVTESEAPFEWHPYAYHYGFDTMLPDDGEYSAEVVIKAPSFSRHHTSHGKRYTDDVTIRMGKVDLILPGGGEEEDDILKQ